MTELIEIQLGKTKTQFIDGDRSSRYPKREEFVEQGVLFLNSESIKFGSINKSVANYISERKYEDIKKGRIKTSDILLTTRGNGVGDAAYVNITDAGIINAQMLILRTDENEIHSKFLFYYLSSKTLYSYVCNFSSGSAQPQIPIRDLKKIPIFLPEIKVQKKIAAILSTYDDLIENNKQRIKLLENMAEEIYKEWFVRFRFPNWQNTEFEKGVPKGWINTKLGNICYITMGQAPKSEFYNEVGDGLPFHQGVGTFGERYPKTEVYCSGDGRIANLSDILFSVRAPVGRLNFADQKMIIGRGLSAIRSKTNNQDYLYYLLKSKFSKEDVIGNGSIFNSVTKDELAGFELLLPHQKVLQKFDELASNINQEISVLFHQISNLNTQKNSLLPRLISGKLSVQQLNIHYPPSMQ